MAQEHSAETGIRASPSEASSRHARAAERIAEALVRSGRASPDDIARLIGPGLTPDPASSSSSSPAAPPAPGRGVEDILVFRRRSKPARADQVNLEGFAEGPTVFRRRDGAVTASAAEATFQRPRRDGGAAMMLDRLTERFSAELADRAATRRPEPASFRAGAAPWQRAAFTGAAVAVAATAVTDVATLAAATAWTGCAVMAANSALWALALSTAGRGGAMAEERPVAEEDLPRVALLVPLYREAETADLLVAALAALDYPEDRIEVKFVLEADDVETRAALDALDRPANSDIVVAPDGAPRTKPRAMNYALDFTEGEIIGVYDAEDRPEPDQIRRIVAAFAAAPGDVACIQARLGYYNARENWLTRCFELEYAAWFDMLLPGLRRAGLPLPLGGTSLFIRRDALEAAGAWDSHNVTEDADLGMALARAGRRTLVSGSVTQEEAASRTGVWIRQRSRWLKGYLATWVTHMRSPRALFSDLGPWRFLGFNAILLSAVLGYLLMPPLLILTLASFWFAPSGATATAMSALSWIGPPTAAALAASVAAGLWRRRRLHYLGWILTVPAYWPLGAAAAYLAAYELAVDPTRWRKTQHGLGEIPSLMRGAAARALQEKRGRAGTGENGGRP